MKRNDIIRMAREAGWPEEAGYALPDTGSMNFKRFAALVAAAERERIIAANAPEIKKINAHIKALEDAVAAEREACAKVCETQWSNVAERMYGEECAAAIRARGQA